MTDKQRLISQAILLVKLGHDVEHKRNIVKRMSEVSMEPTMELFRAIDDFNNSKMDFENLENEHISLRNQIENREI